MHAGAPGSQLDGGDSVPATIFLMSTAVVPKERHAGEKTAGKVGQSKERETISACLLLRRAQGPSGALRGGGEGRSEDGGCGLAGTACELPEEGVPQGWARGSCSPGNEQRAQASSYHQRSLQLAGEGLITSSALGP